MTEWKPTDYLQFKKQRTQPSIDLAARITNIPKRIIDIGCGPGNSTNVLKTNWPESEIYGLDSSENMIASAKQKDSSIQWIHTDASRDLSYLGKFDLVFSNAAIQWIDDNHILLPKLFNMLNSGGVLAVQVPYTEYMPLHIEFMNLLYSPKWIFTLSQGLKMYTKFPPEYYYNIISKLKGNIDFWVTDYYHIMNSHKDLVEWYCSSGLRQFLEIIGPEHHDDFKNEYEGRLKEKYVTQNDNKILFPFTRIFFTVTKG